MKIKEFEKAVWDLENIRIVIRADESSDVGDYPYKNAASQKYTIAKLIEQRIGKKIGPYKIAVVNGSGNIPRLSTKLQTVRESYATPKQR